MCFPLPISWANILSIVREKKIVEILGENWEKLGKTGQNWAKLGKTGENWGKLRKTAENWGKLRKLSF